MSVSVTNFYRQTVGSFFQNRGGEWSLKIYGSQNFSRISRVSQCHFFYRLCTSHSLDFLQSHFGDSLSQSKNWKSLGLAEKNASLAKSRIYYLPPLKMGNDTFLFKPKKCPCQNLSTPKNLPILTQKSPKSPFWNPKRPLHLLVTNIPEHLSGMFHHFVSGDKHKCQNKDCNADKLSAPLYLFIQMQLCQRESLKDWLKASQQRDHVFCLTVFEQVMLTL